MTHLRRLYDWVLHWADTPLTYEVFTVSGGPFMLAFIPL